MSKAKLIKRLKWYYPLEKFHAFATFPSITLYAIFTNNLSDASLLVYGLVLCNYILYQGQYYWKLKLMSLTDQAFDQASNLQFFAYSKRSNQVLLSFMPIIALLQLYLSKWECDQLFFWGVITNIFAFLEYINYYHVQLMYDNVNDMIYLWINRKLKPSSLSKDLKEQKL